MNVCTGAIMGLDAALVEVEADARNGLSRFFIVGLPDAMVQEARERVKSAIKRSNLPFPRGTTIVNLAPADIRKFGTLYDLPIAIAIIGREFAFQPHIMQSTLLAGELALDGSLRPIQGTLSLASLANDAGFSNLIVPKQNAYEASLIPNVRAFAATHIVDVVHHLTGDASLARIPPADIQLDELGDINSDFSSVRGQEHAKRALEIAAAGNHNVLMQGPPGSGKTLLSKCYASILPPLTSSEIIEVTKIWSVAGKLQHACGYVRSRPFRSPHHTASGVSLVGGGTVPRPGEISLAHRGVLFMDEFPEFPRPVLENLRQPLEEGIVSISRIQQTVTYPARFNLIAAMNPCPCGYASDPERACTCAPYQVAAYRKRISGPLLDRIDLHIDVPKVRIDELIDSSSHESSSDIRKRVILARQRQLERYPSTHVLTNSELSSETIRSSVQIEADARSLLKNGVERYQLSARSYFRMIKVAQTIADLASSSTIQLKHVAEAFQYRQSQR